MKLVTLMKEVKNMIKKVIKSGGHRACFDPHNADKYGSLGRWDKNRAQPKTRQTGDFNAFVFSLLLKVVLI